MMIGIERAEKDCRTIDLSNANGAFESVTVGLSETKVVGLKLTAKNGAYYEVGQANIGTVQRVTIPVTDRLVGFEGKLTSDGRISSFSTIEYTCGAELSPLKEKSKTKTVLIIVFSIGITLCIFIFFVWLSFLDSFDKGKERPITVNS